MHVVSASVGDLLPHSVLHLSQFMRLWYLSHRRPAKAQASLRSLTRIFAVHTHDIWKEGKALTKNQTSSPSGWLHMRV